MPMIRTENQIIELRGPGVGNVEDHELEVLLVLDVLLEPFHVLDALHQDPYFGVGPPLPNFLDPLAEILRPLIQLGKEPLGDVGILVQEIPPVALALLGEYGGLYGLLLWGRGGNRGSLRGAQAPQLGRGRTQVRARLLQGLQGLRQLGALAERGGLGSPEGRRHRSHRS